jgi:hypothetical protein
LHVEVLSGINGFEKRRTLVGGVRIPLEDDELLGLLQFSFRASIRNINVSTPSPITSPFILSANASG